MEGWEGGSDRGRSACYAKASLRLENDWSSFKAICLPVVKGSRRLDVSRGRSTLSRNSHHLFGLEGSSTARSPLLA